MFQFSITTKKKGFLMAECPECGKEKGNTTVKKENGDVAHRCWSCGHYWEEKITN
jgi:uncharacterized Zn finger protein